MNRWKFIAMLFGGGALAKAQKLGSDGDGPNWQSGKPLNNQCPVCGVLAPPYVRLECKHDGPCYGIPGNETTPFYKQHGPVGPMSRRIDCERCNNTFRQVAEK